MASALIVFFASFLLGSVPYGLIISKVFYHKDIRQEGSGNIGTTNAMRSMGKVGGAAVFVLDFGKGVVSGLLALWLSQAGLLGAPEAGQGLLMALAFAGCTFGHIYSPWLKFKGGKGIAVAVGALFVVFGWVGACLELAIFAVLVVATRYVSVGSIAAALLCPFLAFFYYWGDWPAAVIISVTALNVVFAHRANIDRLLHHCENRIGSKKEEGAA